MRERPIYITMTLCKEGTRGEKTKVTLNLGEFKTHTHTFRVGVARFSRSINIHFCRNYLESLDLQRVG